MLLPVEDNTLIVPHFMLEIPRRDVPMTFDRLFIPARAN